MTKKYSDKTRRLTPPQVAVLKGYILNKTMTSLASGAYAELSGKPLGAIHSSLSRIGFIEPIGKNSDRSLNFKLVDEVGAEKDEILKIIDEIEKFNK